MIVAGKTHRGMVRKNNQDTLTRLHTEQDSALLVVCDGMGGAAAGNIASTIERIPLQSVSMSCLRIRQVRRFVLCGLQLIGRMRRFFRSLSAVRNWRAWAQPWWQL